MNPNQKKLLAFIKVKGCLLDPDEIIDFYVVNVQRRVCRIGILESPKDAKDMIGQYCGIRREASILMPWVG